MALQIISRTKWNARAPRAVTAVSLSSRRHFIVHYSAANKFQTPRQIQNFHMDTNGWNDIGYNFLVDYTGKAYMGRGWYNLGTHTIGYNTTGIAVCFIGTNTDVTDAAKATIRELALEADRLTKRKLTRGGHRDYDATQCPGNELHSWVHAGMPLPRGNDVAFTPQQEKDIHDAAKLLLGQRGKEIRATNERLESIVSGKTQTIAVWSTAGGVDENGNGTSVEPNRLSEGLWALLNRPQVNVDVMALATEIVRGLTEDGVLTSEQIEQAIENVFTRLTVVIASNES